MSTDRDLNISHGFDAGNYANAYDTQNLEDAWAQRNALLESEDWGAAFLLGFFSSYELHEIPGDARDRFDEAYYSDAGQRVLELGYTESRRNDYVCEERENS